MVGHSGLASSAESGVKAVEDESCEGPGWWATVYNTQNF